MSEGRVPCPDCPFRRGEIVIEDEMAAVVTVQGDGEFQYVGTTGCGVAVGRISGIIMQEEYPAIVERMRNCQEPTTTVVDKPRGSILGKMLRIVDQVPEARCVITHEEASAVITNERIV